VSSSDLIFEVLTKGEADAALAASIFHFGEHTVADVKRVLESKGVPIRKGAG
jgi:cyclase